MLDFPPDTLFRFLTPQQRQERLEAAADMLELMAFWRGDPRLSWWQEGFLTEMCRRLRLSGGRYKVSHKEWIKFWEIRDLMLSDLVEAEPREELTE